jgi:hypothetical protein
VVATFHVGLAAVVSPMPDPLLPAPTLAAPPTDVQVLLNAAGVAGSVSVYFDAQQSAALQQAQRQWPALWRMAFGET